MFADRFPPSVVSLALGRPFAIQDDDITVEVYCLFFSSLFFPFKL
jgi:hypothetical protein